MQASFSIDGKVQSAQFAAFKKKYPKFSIELKIISLNSKVETFR